MKNDFPEVPGQDNDALECSNILDLFADVPLDLDEDGEYDDERGLPRWEPKDDDVESMIDHTEFNED